jgi:hypothetical protein
MWRWGKKRLQEKSYIGHPFDGQSFCSADKQPSAPLTLQVHAPTFYPVNEIRINLLAFAPSLAFFAFNLLQFEDRSGPVSDYYHHTEVNRGR